MRRFLKIAGGMLAGAVMLLVGLFVYVAIYGPPTARSQACYQMGNYISAHHENMGISWRDVSVERCLDNAVEDLPRLWDGRWMGCQLVIEGSLVSPPEAMKDCLAAAP